jgi:hypothetical protein
MIALTAIERRVWAKVQRSQATQKPLPNFSPCEATATDEQWIKAAKRAHEKRPICLDQYYDTEPTSAETLGYSKRIPARALTPKKAPSSSAKNKGGSEILSYAPNIT